MNYFKKFILLSLIFLTFDFFFSQIFLKKTDFWKKILQENLTIRNNVDKNFESILYDLRDTIKSSVYLFKASSEEFKTFSIIKSIIYNSCDDFLCLITDIIHHKNNVQNHGGTLKIKSGDEGTIFNLEIPKNLLFMNYLTLPGCFSYTRQYRRQSLDIEDTSSG